MMNLPVIPAWLVAAFMFLAALSFLARHRAQVKHGRIREYVHMSFAVALLFLAIAIWYIEISINPSDEMLVAMRPVIRVLLILLGIACVSFNWGGVRTFYRDMADRWFK